MMRCGVFRERPSYFGLSSPSERGARHIAAFPGPVPLDADSHFHSISPHIRCTINRPESERDEVPSSVLSNSLHQPRGCNDSTQCSNANHPLVSFHFYVYLLDVSSFSLNLQLSSDLFADLHILSHSNPSQHQHPVPPINPILPHSCLAFKSEPLELTLLIRFILHTGSHITQFLPL